MIKIHHAVGWIAQLVLASLAHGQQGPVILGAGYTAPTGIRIAPGQVVNIFARLSKLLVGEVIAPGPNLAEELAGVRLTIGSGPTVPIPLFKIRPLYSCLGLTVIPPFCFDVAISGQIPYTFPASSLGDPVFPTSIYIQEDGSPPQWLDTRVFPHQIRLVSGACPLLYDAAFGFGCARVVYRLNGLPVQSVGSVKSGETLILYAFGLGLTEPRVRAGEPAVAAEVERFRRPILILEFSFLASPRPWNGLPPDSPNVVVVEPEYMGLAPGQIGLYQINFVMPKVPPDLRRCRSSPDSNVTISVAGFYSFDGVGFCAEPDAEGGSQ